jgi:ribosomal protein S18 acetylase RimI-like enzyme
MVSNNNGVDMKRLSYTFFDHFQDAEAQFDRPMMELPGDGCLTGQGNEILVAHYGNKAAGWFLFDALKSKRSPVRIYHTGIYICREYRKKGLGKKLTHRSVKMLDKRYGRGKYYFESEVISNGGMAVWNYRISLTGNPKAHKCQDDRHFHIGETY